VGGNTEGKRIRLRGKGGAFHALGEKFPMEKKERGRNHVAVRHSEAVQIGVSEGGGRGSGKAQRPHTPTERRRAMERTKLPRRTAQQGLLLEKVPLH